MFKDLILNCRSFILENYFFKRKVGQSLDVDGRHSLLQFTQKEELQQVVLILWQREVLEQWLAIYPNC